ncbi:RNA polymerase sigma factor [Paenibacillus sp. S150]|uniref:RNA polymerase sigma factor n=1 Tax=Paenibacillus sp. S150 TaxID=2749826 RepID=UPI001C57E19F|nr:RNA polymerase sigma factor [Paenibacillus sp. S150]MBW4082240.1 RNA polymerase sigma factor [Paenibacillus sp. S150]
MKVLESYSTGILMDEQKLLPLREALYRYCLSLTRSRVEAEDLAQDTWSKSLAYEKFADNPNPEALLLRIAKNTWIDALRRQASRGRVLEHAHAAAAPDHLRIAEPSPENSLTEMELAFQALIRHLSPLQRTVFVMRDVLGYPAGETAEILETTEGAVKAALHRARQALGAVRKELAEGGGPAQPQDMDLRILLRALAESYDKGQLPVLLELLRRETAAEITMAVGYGTVQALHLSGGLSGAGMSAGSMAMLRMAA